MLTMTMGDVTDVTGGALHGVDLSILSVETDSRKAMAAGLFIALKGDNFDGHQFCQKALENGAIALLVEQKLALACSQIVVTDTRLALGAIARWQRQQFSGPVAAITGSNGKTTVKEMVAAILAQDASVLATQGNFNNDIGLPLTLLNLDENVEAMVLELGANHGGEITYTAEIAKPQVALVNNVSDAHIEGFGSREGVARAKSEIFTDLGVDDTAIFAVDSPDASLFERQAAPARCWRFGVAGETCEFMAQQIELLGLEGARFELNTPQGSIDINLQVPGQHNVANATAAAAAAMGMGASLEQIRAGLADFAGVHGRLNRSCPKQGLVLIDDSYNANPASYQAALELLASQSEHRILVAGEMSEMGEQSLVAHETLGELVAALGVELFATGSMMRATVEKAGSHHAHYFDTQDGLIEAVGSRIAQLLPSKAVTVLIKGSRSTRMERVVQALQEH